MIPIFLYVLSTGDIWVSNSPDFTPAGTILADFRISPGVRSQKIGTISGNAGSYACSGGFSTGNKRDPKNEIV